MLAYTDSFTSPKAKGVTECLTNFADAFVNHDLTPWYYRLITSVRMIALHKPDGGVRPIAVGCPIRAWATKCAYTQEVKKSMAEYMQGQFAVGVEGGMSKYIFGTAVHLWQEQTAAVVIDNDVDNAFQNSERNNMIQAYVNCPKPEIRALARLNIATLNNTSPIVFHSGPERQLAPFNSVQGAQQGSVEGMPSFCMGLDSALKKVPHQQGSVIAAFADNITIAGGPDSFHLLTPLRYALTETANLTLNPSKSKYAANALAAQAAAELANAHNIPLCSLPPPRD